VDLVDTHPGGDGLRHPSVVAGQHDDLPDTVGVQTAHHLCGVVADPVRDRNHAQHDAVAGDDHRRPACRGQSVHDRGGDRRIDALGVQQPQVAHEHAVRAELGDDAPARDRFGVGGQPPDVQAPLGGGSDQGVGQRMLRPGLGPGGDGEESVGVHAVGQHHDVGQVRPALGEGARLVERDGGDPRGGLEELAPLDQDAVAGAAPDAGHDRHRDRDDEGARAADHEQRQREVAVAGDQADDEREQHDAGGIPAREAVHELLGLRLGVLRLLDAVDDAGHGGVGAHPGGLHLEEAGGGDRAGEHPVAGGLLGRDRLTGDGRLVDRRGAAEDEAVDGHLGPVLHEHRLTGLNGGGRDLDLLPVAQDDRQVGRHRDQLGQRRPGPVQRGVLQRPADREQEGHGGGLPEVTDHEGPDRGHRDE